MPTISAPLLTMWIEFVSIDKLTRVTRDKTIIHGIVEKQEVVTVHLSGMICRLNNGQTMTICDRPGKNTNSFGII